MRRPFLTLFVLAMCCHLSGAASLSAAPRNDAFAKSRNLSGERITTHGTTIGATIEPEELFMSRNTVWFKWNAPANGMFRFSLTPADAVEVTVFAGQDFSHLVQRTDAASQVVLRVDRGQQYRIRVNSGFEGDARFTLRIRQVSPPPNDDIADAIAFAGTNSTIEGTLLYSTLDSGGPISFRGQGNVWYRWEAPGDGLFMASVDSELDTVYASVFHGSNSLTSIGQSITGLKRGAAFYATNGGSYWISANGYSALSSNFTLTVSAETPPPNDHFENSTVVAGAEVSITGTSRGATFVPGEPSYVFPRPPPPAPPPGPALPPSPTFSVPKAAFPVLTPQLGYVWYSWVATTTGVYRISANLFVPPPTGLGRPLSPTDVLVVLTGDSLPQLTQVASGY
ncbi:MAG TPA: hypothetical protein VK846_01125, partial [Candidatus Limnocylindria bacterium]|nr:hypothetical protein [Candidatus Limnocylindria bacterium]